MTNEERSRLAEIKNRYEVTMLDIFDITEFVSDAYKDIGWLILQIQTLCNDNDIYEEKLIKIYDIANGARLMKEGEQDND